MRILLFRVMLLLRRWYARLGREGRAQELSEEMAFHVDMLIRDCTARGLSPEEARTAALRQFGNRTVLAEEAHGMWSIGALDVVLRDVRVALRGFRRAPVFAVTAVLILALGIGTAVAMFTVSDSVLLRELPVRDEDRIVLPRALDNTGTSFQFLPWVFEQIRHDARTMSDVAGVAYSGASAFPLVDGDRPVVLERGPVTGNFFDLLGARPLLGRLLRPEDDVKGAVPVIVLSYRAWQRDFGGDPDVVGRSLTDQYWGWHYPIVGVAPPGLDYPAGVDFWVSVTPLGGAPMYVIGRLAPGATPASAQAEFLSLVERSRASANDTLPVALVRADARTLPQVVVGEVQPTLIVLDSAAALLLLIACVNVGNLLLLRASARSRELSVRRALGASSGNIARQLLVESGLLAVAAGALGLLCAVLLLHALLVLAPVQLPRTDVIELAGTPLGVAAAATLLSALIFGLLPALSAARGAGSVLRVDSRSGFETTRRRRVRQWLVASQVALAVILLAGAGLLARSLQRLDQIQLGYTPEHLSLFTLATPAADSTQEQLYGMFEDLAPRLRAIPGVTAVTPILLVPFHGTDMFLLKPTIEGQTPAEAAANPFIPWEDGGPDYFRTFGIPLLRGRGFLETDRADAPKVVVVSQSVAERLWPGEDPIGKRIRTQSDTLEWRTVVGVAGDIRFRSLRRANPTIYVPWQQIGWQGEFAARTTGDLASVLPAMRRAVRDVDPRLSIWQAQTMDELLGVPLAQPRMSTLILSSFGLVALLLAAIGLYGVMASAVREQTREIGVRMALGATPEQLRRHVLGDALIVIVVGASVGMGGALLGGRLLTSLLYQVSPSDPVALAGVSVLLVLVGLTSAYLPARRATRVDPAQVLRAE
jgi:predicted permease